MDDAESAAGVWWEAVKGWGAVLYVLGKCVGLLT